MKIIIILVAVNFLNACAGLAVGTYGKFEQSQNEFVTHEKGKFTPSIHGMHLSEKELVALWGKPTEVYTDGQCQVLSYKSGLSWTGVGAFVIFVPVPLLVPTGQHQKKFYFRDGKSVGLVKSYGQVKSALGFMCGSNECKSYAGRVNYPENRNAITNWCS